MICDCLLELYQSILLDLEQEIEQEIPMEELEADIAQTLDNWDNASL